MFRTTSGVLVSFKIVQETLKQYIKDLRAFEEFPNDKEVFRRQIASLRSGKILHH